jgi:hypothetical protein
VCVCVPAINNTIVDIVTQIALPLASGFDERDERVDVATAPTAADNSTLAKVSNRNLLPRWGGALIASSDQRTVTKVQHEHSQQ